MRRLPLRSHLALAFAAACATSAAAAPRDSAPDRLVDANRLIGTAVRSGGQRVGKVRDVVVERNSSRVAFVTMTFDSSWFRSESHFALPWSSLEVAEGGASVTLRDVAPEALEAAPGFNPRIWPDMTDSDWMDRTDEAFGIDRRALFDVDDRRLAFRRLTELIGTDVENLQKEELGELENVYIADREGRLAFALISQGGFAGLNERLLPVPWTALDLRAWQERALVDVDRQALTELVRERYSPRDLENRSLARRVHRHFDVDPYWETYGDAREGGTQTGATRPSRGGTGSSAPETAEPEGAPEEGEAGAPEAPAIGRGEGAGNEAWRAGSEFNARFRADQMTTVTGVVESVGSFRPAPGADPGLRLKLREEPGTGVHVVYAGPSHFVGRHDVEVTRGDRITVVGSPAEIDGRRVLLAQQITGSAGRIVLRDPRGAPLWEDPEAGTATGAAPGQDKPRE